MLLPFANAMYKKTNKKKKLYDSEPLVNFKKMTILITSSVVSALISVHRKQFWDAILKNDKPL